MSQSHPVQRDSFVSVNVCVHYLHITQLWHFSKTGIKFHCVCVVTDHITGFSLWTCRSTSVTLTCLNTIHCNSPLLKPNCMWHYTIEAGLCGQTRSTVYWVSLWSLSAHCLLLCGGHAAGLSVSLNVLYLWTSESCVNNNNNNKLNPGAVNKACVCVYRPHETVVPLEDPIVTEVTSTLQEWASLWKQLYVVSSTKYVFSSMSCHCSLYSVHWHHALRDGSQAQQAERTKGTWAVLCRAIVSKSRTSH